MASKMLSAHPIDMERNCFVASPPKRVRSGPTAVPIVLIKSVQSVAVTIGAGDEGEVDVVAGAKLRFIDTKRLLVAAFDEHKSVYWRRGQAESFK
jgi:hypothetical protein